MEFWSLGIYFALGLVLATLYFGGLWLTVRTLLADGQHRRGTLTPALIAMVSFLLRSAGLLSVVYCVVRAGAWPAGLALLGGILVGRQGMTHWLGPGTSVSHRERAEAHVSDSAGHSFPGSLPRRES